jgi:small-conductance mechanosensitive channel
VEQYLTPRISKIQTKSFDLIQAGLVLEGMKGSMSVLHGGIIALLIYFHMGYVLRQFPWSRPFADGLLGLVLGPIQSLWISFVSSLPGLMAVFVIGVVFYVAHRTLKLFFVGLQTGTIQVAGFDPDWAVPTFRIVRVALIALGVMLAYPHIPGSNSMAFKGVSVFLGIIISLGSSSFAANLIAGYSAIYRRAFRIGDWIEVDNFRGEVLEIQTLVTRLRSFRNEVIVIPNSAIINSPVINYSTYAKDRGLVLHTTVGIGYETPWRQVEAMLLQAAARTPGLLTDPKPFVLQKGLGDFCVTYEINVFCSTPGTRLALTHALHQNILDVFNENNVQIMTPAYEGDPAQPKLVPKDKWYTPLVAPER